MRWSAKQVDSHSRGLAERLQLVYSPHHSPFYVLVLSRKKKLDSGKGGPPLYFPLQKVTPSPKLFWLCIQCQVPASNSTVSDVCLQKVEQLVHIFTSLKSCKAVQPSLSNPQKVAHSLCWSNINLACSTLIV